MTIDLESLRGFTPGPHPVAKANHGSDHYTIGDGPPFIGVARKEADAQLFAVAYAMHAELTARRADRSVLAARVGGRLEVAVVHEAEWRTK